MTVRTAMRAASAAEAGGVGGAGSGPAVAPDATVSEAIEAVARAGVPARVVDQGRCVGMVDSDALLGVVAGTGDSGSAGGGGGAGIGNATSTGGGSTGDGPDTGVREELTDTGKEAV